MDRHDRAVPNLDTATSSFMLALQPGSMTVPSNFCLVLMFLKLIKFTVHLCLSPSQNDFTHTSTSTSLPTEPQPSQIALSTPISPPAASLAPCHSSKPDGRKMVPSKPKQTACLLWSKTTSNINPNKVQPNAASLF